MICQAWDLPPSEVEIISTEPVQQAQVAIGNNNIQVQGDIPPGTVIGGGSLKAGHIAGGNINIKIGNSED